MLQYHDSSEPKHLIIMNTAYAATTSASQIAGESTSELAKLIEVILTKIPLWISAFIVFLAAIIIAKIARSMVESKLAESGVEDDHKELQVLGGRVTYATILTLGITVALKIAGIDLTTIIAAVGFGIGFALKDLIVNFLAGMMILIGGHFSIGDFIKINGILGKVEEIQSRVTILRAIDGTKVVVPNADLFNNSVTSMTSNPFRRLEIIVGIDYRNNLENAIRVMMDAVGKTKGVLIEPKPAVIVDKFGESSIDLKVRAWVESKSAWIKTKSNLVVNIKKELDEYGITIPWPIRTIAYDKDQESVEKIMEEEKSTEAVAPISAPETPKLE
ncbi:mechanosensitive ion channel family protein, partial [Patescibacteria group bacterium]|nr:mechanosensitive ion channel family protein [Patescibacteria group bacterium]